MLITVTARVVRSHGTGDVPLPSEGVIEYRPESHGVLDGALRARDRVSAPIVAGLATPVELAPGVWSVHVLPKHGRGWEAWRIELTEGMPEPVDLADLAPAVVIDGEKWARGEAGHTPVLTWDGPRLLIDGVPGPDLTGPQGPEADTTAAIAAYTNTIGA